MEDHAQDHYYYLKKFLAISEKNKVVRSYRDFERMKVSGGGEEDPYDKQYRILITESPSLK